MPVGLLIAAVVIAVLIIFIVVLDKVTAFFTARMNRRHARATLDLTYIQGSVNPKHRLDMYRPKKPTSTYPFVMFVHGGYWTSGDKNYHQSVVGLYASIGYVLAKMGIGTAVVNYRLSPETAIAGQVEDVTAAKDFVLTHLAEWGGNGQLFLMGHSAGGHLVSLLQAKDISHTLAGTIALSPILDVGSMVQTAEPDFNERISFPVFGNDSALWPQYSPLELLQQQPDQADRLSVFVAEHDFPYLKQRALEIRRVFQATDHPLLVEVMEELNHMKMVTAFGKSSNTLAEKVGAIIKKGA